MFKVSKGLRNNISIFPSLVSRSTSRAVLFQGTNSIALPCFYLASFGKFLSSQPLGPDPGSWTIKRSSFLPTPPTHHLGGFSLLPLLRNGHISPIPASTGRSPWFGTSPLKAWRPWKKIRQRTVDTYAQCTLYMRYDDTCIYIYIRYVYTYGWI